MAEGQVQSTKVMVDAVCRLAMLVPLADAEELVREIERTEAFMPLVDPTGYRGIAKTLPGHLEAAQAFLAFRSALQGLSLESKEATR